MKGGICGEKAKMRCVGVGVCIFAKSQARFKEFSKFQTERRKGMVHDENGYGRVCIVA